VKGKAASKTAPAPSFGNADAITDEELKIHLYFLASDQLEGRNFPSRGYDTAALYVAAQLANWGLTPLGSPNSTVGPLQPYFMPIEMVSRSIVPEESKLTLTLPAGGGRGGRGAPPEGRPVNFDYGKAWNATGLTQTLDVAGNLVFAGNGYVLNKSKQNPYETLDAKGKIVVIAGLPPELAQRAAGRGGRGGAPAAAAPAPTAGVAPAPGTAANPAPPPVPAPDPLGEACTDYLTPAQAAAKNGAVAVIRIPTFQQLSAMNSAPATPPVGPNGPTYTPLKFQQTPDCPSVPTITAGLELTDSLFQGEKLSGSHIFYAAGNNTKLDSFELSGRKKVNVRVALKSQQGHGENVVAMLEGSDPVLKNEYVILSAHLDHVGFSAASNPDADTINNGADDDGSGSTGLLGIAHAYATGAAKGVRPKRSMIFLWVGGEEKGLWGSQYFTQFPPIDLSRVVADLNIDMIGRIKTPGFTDPNTQHVLVNPGELLLIGPNVSSDDLGKTIESVNAAYHKLTFNHFYDVTAPDATHDNLGPQPNGQRIFYRSDHYNFAKMGIPVAFFTTGLHPDYHRPSDSPDKIDYKAMQTISKTVAAIAWELATQSGRPKLNEKLPDQLQRDMKAVKAQGWGKVTPVLPPLPGMPY
jgi:hypothetical protein